VPFYGYTGLLFDILPKEKQRDKKIIDVAQKYGWTQQQIAVKLNMHCSTISSLATSWGHYQVSIVALHLTGKLSTVFFLLAVLPFLAAAASGKLRRSFPDSS
jgi:hypothetical protein